MLSEENSEGGFSGSSGSYSFQNRWALVIIFIPKCASLTGLSLSNKNTKGQAVGLLVLVLRKASGGTSIKEIIVEG